MKARKELIPLLILPGILCGQTLHLKNLEIAPGTRRVETLEASGPRWTAGRSHLILQFHSAVNRNIIEELNRRGAIVVGAVPDFGVAVSVPDDFSVEGLNAAWAGRLEAEYKISPLLERAVERERWFVAEFFPDVDMDEARHMAEAAGFDVHAHPDLISSHLLLSGAVERLGSLAQWDEVAYLFPASRDLIQGNHVGHCAGALTTGGVTPMYVTSGSGWSKDSSGTVTLSYVFGTLTPKLDSAQAMQTILQALTAWTQYAPVKFVAGQSAAAPRTVYIWFAEYDHGDGYPFDGPGGILAHTFYPAPPNSESIAGDMHFDGSENWHIGANTDLATVALHEAGHALGLAHVDNPAALMYPYYSLGQKISEDDIAGVQALYVDAGAPAATTAPSPLTLAITNPSANSTTSSATIAVSGTSSGAIGAEQVTWQVGQGTSGTASGSTQWSIPSVPLTVGSNTITVTAADSSRKVAQTVSVTRSAPTATTPDATPPAIAISSPATNTVTTSSATIAVSGTASDSVGVTKVTWQAPWGSGTASGTTSWSASAIPLLVGNNLITMRAYDARGNQACQSILVVRK
jgi:hypothetical protein